MSLAWKKTLAGALFALSLTMILFSAYSNLESYYLEQQVDGNNAALQLVKAGLEGSLKRHEPIPALLSDKKNIVELLTSLPGDTKQIDLVNGILKEIAENVGASDIYVLDQSGLTIASSNFDKPYSFIGRSFTYRPYFVDAMNGNNASFFALGTTSLKRGFYFSAPVTHADKIVGVVVLKITVDEMEESWQGGQHDFIVSDKHGVIFMASQAEWQFKSLGPLSDAARSEIARTKQYPSEHLSDLGFTDESPGHDSLLLWTISNHMDGDNSSETFLVNSSQLGELGLKLQVLSPISIALNQAYTAIAITLLAIIAIALMIGMAWFRRAQLLANLRFQENVNRELERRVESRTFDLKSTNEQLRLEVAERTRAEDQLRKTQKELVQTGKLAALGQMSAALSHEINQPLAAIKTYAENAKQFLQRKNTAQVQENITQISKLSDRMAEIGNHLRNFARKPGTVTRAIDIKEVLSAVEQIMQARVKREGADLKIDPCPETLLVFGGYVRLQQVFVNLVNNALDSMEGMPQPAVHISFDLAEADKVSVHVRDFGRGVDEDVIGSIFDPFFTTKGVNQGLGLGLSISYNVVQDFDGELRVSNHPEGGAVFTVSLQRSVEIRNAAE